MRTCLFVQENCSVSMEIDKSDEKCAEKHPFFLSWTLLIRLTHYKIHSALFGGRNEREQVSSFVELCVGGLQQPRLLFSSRALDTRLTAQPRSKSCAIQTEILLNPN